MITFFHISYNLTGKWNFYIDFFQVLTCCNISNFGLIKKCYGDNLYIFVSNIKNQYKNFLFFQKHKKWSSFLNFGWIWLVNEFVLTFSALIKCAQAQFNLIILSRVIEYTIYYRQTDRHFRKNHFF